MVDVLCKRHASDGWFGNTVITAQVGNFYDTYDWLCGRPSPTVYIDEMKEALLLRIQKKLS